MHSNASIASSSSTSSSSSSSSSSSTFAYGKRLQQLREARQALRRKDSAVRPPAPSPALSLLSPPQQPQQQPRRQHRLALHIVDPIAATPSSHTRGQLSVGHHDTPPASPDRSAPRSCITTADFASPLSSPSPPPRLFESLAAPPPPPPALHSSSHSSSTTSTLLKELKRVESHHAVQLTLVRRDADTRIAQLERMHAARLRRLQRALTAARAHTARLASRYRTTLHTLHHRHRLRRKRDACTIRRLRQRLDQTVAQHRIDSDTRCSAITNTFEQRVHDLTQVSCDLESRLTHLLTQSNDREAALRQQLDGTTKLLRECEAQRDELERQHRAAAELAHAQRNTIAQLEQQLCDLRESHAAERAEFATELRVVQMRCHDEIEDARIASAHDVQRAHAEAHAARDAGIAAIRIQTEREVVAAQRTHQQRCAELHERHRAQQLALAQTFTHAVRQLKSDLEGTARATREQLDTYADALAHVVVPDVEAAFVRFRTIVSDTSAARATASRVDAVLQHVAATSTVASPPTAAATTTATTTSAAPPPSRVLAQPTMTTTTTAPSLLLTRRVTSLERELHDRIAQQAELQRQVHRLCDAIDEQHVQAERARQECATLARQRDEEVEAARIQLDAQREAFKQQRAVADTQHEEAVLMWMEQRAELLDRAERAERAEHEAQRALRLARPQADAAQRAHTMRSNEIDELRSACAVLRAQLQSAQSAWQSQHDQRVHAEARAKQELNEAIDRSAQRERALQQRVDELTDAFARVEREHAQQIAAPAPNLNESHDKSQPPQHAPDEPQAPSSSSAACSECERLRADVRSLRADRARLQVDVAAAREQLVRAQNEAKQTRAAVKQLEDDASNARLRAQQEHERSAARIASLLRSKSDLASEVTALRAAAKQLEQERTTGAADAQRDRDAAINECAALQQELDRVRIELQRVQSDVQRVQGELQQAHAREHKLARERARLEMAQTSQAAQLSETIAELSLARLQITDLTQHLSQAQTEAQRAQDLARAERDKFSKLLVLRSFRDRER